jgi:hypothetical protein
MRPVTAEPASVDPELGRGQGSADWRVGGGGLDSCFVNPKPRIPFSFKDKAQIWSFRNALFFFLMGLGFELRASHFQSRHSVF